MLSSIYLTGDNLEAPELINQLPTRDWRSFALTKLQNHGLKVVNPLELAWSGVELVELGEVLDISQGADMRVRRALDLIDQCDAMLANLNRSSYGTAMEMFYAYRRGKIVAVVGQSPFHPWVLSHSQVRFGDVDTALDYIIGEQPHSAPLNWALQYERLLAERYEQLPPAGEPDYKFLGGEIPVLVMAPHATAHWREGEFLESEAYTGSMSAMLNRTSSCHTLLSYYCCVADPCWYLETPFRRAFADIVKTGQIGLVIMLLGSSWYEAPGLQVYGHGPSTQVLEDYLTRLKLKLSSLEPVMVELPDYGVQPLAVFAAQELGVTTIVVKMHKRYRMPRLQPELYAKITGLLNEFITETGLELSRSNG